MTRTLVGILFAGVLGFGQTAPEQKQRPGRTTMEAHRAMVPAADKKFAVEAIQGGMTEVELGQMAQQKATNPEVKRFGERMVTDHSKLNEELRSVAASQNITLPTSLDAYHQGMVDRLSKLSGPEFDRAYVKLMVKDHDGDVKEFTHQAQYAQNPALRSFASKSLPVLEEHQKLIHEINRKLYGKTPGSTGRQTQ